MFVHDSFAPAQVGVGQEVSAFPELGGPSPAQVVLGHSVSGNEEKQNTCFVSLGAI